MNFLLWGWKWRKWYLDDVWDSGVTMGVGGWQTAIQGWGGDTRMKLFFAAEFTKNTGETLEGGDGRSSDEWWAVGLINYFLVNFVIKLLWSSWLEKFNYSKVIGNWVVVKLLFKVVNYQVIKLLKSSWRSFCLPVDSYPFTYLTGTV